MNSPHDHVGPYRQRDGGFTLVELLVVMIVLGVLAAIAIPAYLQSRRKAYDTGTKSDVTAVGQAMVSYYLDNPTAPLVYGQINNNHTVRLATSNFSYIEDVNITYGSVVTGFTAGATPTTWCVSMGNGAGSSTLFRYSPAGLETGSCAP